MWPQPLKPSLQSAETTAHELPCWLLQSVSAVTWWQQTVSHFPQATQTWKPGTRNWQMPGHNDVFCLRNHVSGWFLFIFLCAVQLSLSLSVAPTLYSGLQRFWVPELCKSVLSLTRLVFGDDEVTGLQAIRLIQSASIRGLAFIWLMFHTLTPAVTQSWCKGRLCFWLFVIYRALAGWGHSVSVVKKKKKKKRKDTGRRAQNSALGQGLNKHYNNTNA